MFLLKYTSFGPSKFWLQEAKHMRIHADLDSTLTKNFNLSSKVTMLWTRSARDLMSFPSVRASVRRAGLVEGSRRQPGGVESALQLPPTGRRPAVWRRLVKINKFLCFGSRSWHCKLRYKKGSTPAKWWSYITNKNLKLRYPANSNITTAKSKIT